MVLELHFYFIYLEAWWQDKLYHTHQYRIYKTSEQYKISYHNPRSPMPLSLGISMYDVDIKIHVFQHCNIQIFSVHIGDCFFFIERFAGWHECRICRPELRNAVIVYQYGHFFGNICLGFAEYVWNEINPSSFYENS